MNTTSSDKKITSLRLSKNLMLFLQQKAKLENRSFNNYIETLLYSASGFGIPNEDSQKAMMELKNNRNDLRRITSVDKFLEEMKNG